MSSTQLPSIPNNPAFEKENLVPINEAARKENLVPINEAARLLALKQTKILYSDTSELEFDRFTALSRRIFKMPYAFISFMDYDQNWIKSFAADIGTSKIVSIPRNVCFCARSLFPESPEIEIVSDLQQNLNFRENPLVNASPYLRYFASATIIVQGFKLGSLWIADITPHEYTSMDDRQNLLDLSAAVSKILEVRRERYLRTKKERDNLMLGLNHNLRTPLMSLHLVTEMLRTEVIQLNASKAKIKDRENFINKAINTSVDIKSLSRTPSFKLNSSTPSNGHVPTIMPQLDFSNHGATLVRDGDSSGPSSRVPETEYESTNIDSVASKIGNFMVQTREASQSDCGDDKTPRSIINEHSTRSYRVQSDASEKHNLVESRSSVGGLNTPDIPCIDLLSDLQGSIQQLGLLVEMGLILGKLSSSSNDLIACDMLKVYKKVQLLTQRFGTKSQKVSWAIDRSKLSSQKKKQYSHPDVLLFVLTSCLSRFLPHADRVTIKGKFVAFADIVSIGQDQDAKTVMIKNLADLIASTLIVGEIGVLVTELEIKGDAVNLLEIVKKLDIHTEKSKKLSSSDDDKVDVDALLDETGDDFMDCFFSIGNQLENVFGRSDYVKYQDGIVFNFSLPCIVEISEIPTTASSNSENEKESDLVVENTPQAQEAGDNTSNLDSIEMESENVSIESEQILSISTRSKGSKPDTQSVHIPLLPLFTINTDKIIHANSNDASKDEHNALSLTSGRSSNGSVVSNGSLASNEQNERSNSKSSESKSKSSEASVKIDPIEKLALVSPLVASIIAPSVGRPLVTIEEDASETLTEKMIENIPNNSQIVYSAETIPMQTFSEWLSRRPGQAVTNGMTTKVMKQTKISVLLVDDSLTVQKVLGMWLKRKKCEVTTALNGVKALEFLYKNVYDIVLMDFLMPVMDGLTCVRTFSSWCFENQLEVEYEKQLIIGLSATALQIDQDMAFESGMQLFCSKPVDMIALSNIIEAKRAGLSFNLMCEYALEKANPEAVIDNESSFGLSSLQMKVDDGPVEIESALKVPQYHPSRMNTPEEHILKKPTVRFSISDLTTMSDNSNEHNGNGKSNTNNHSKSSYGVSADHIIQSFNKTFGSFRMNKYHF